MPILCPQAKIAFFPGFNWESTELKHVIRAIKYDGEPPNRARGINSWGGWKTELFKPEHLDVPEGYEKITLIKDPIDQWIENWSGLARSSVFRKAGVAEAMKEEDLDLDPGILRLANNLDAYGRHYPRLTRALSGGAPYLGPDLSVYDRVFTADNIVEAQEYFYDKAGVRMRVWRATPDGIRNMHLTEEAAERLKEITADQYAWGAPYLTPGKSVQLTGTFHPKTTRIAPPPVFDEPSFKPAENYSVTCMLKERPELVRTFVRYYKGMGFSQINLYFDDPADPMADELDPDPIVNVIRCGEEFWHGIRRADGLEGRQRICFKRAYEAQRDGWMMFCDADEFIWSDRPLPELLASAPPDQRYVRTPSSEPVWSFDQPIDNEFSANYIRMPVWGPRWRDIAEQMYADHQKIFKWGMLSHIVGKYMVRCGEDVDAFKTHYPFFSDGTVGKRVGEDHVTLRLIHYDALSFPQWCGKLDKRLVKGHSYAGMSDVRKLQVKQYARRNQAEREQFFRELYTLDADGIATMSHYGLLGRLTAFDDIVKTAHTPFQPG